MSYDPGLSSFGQGLFEGQVPPTLSSPAASASDQQLGKLLGDILTEMKAQSQLMREDAEPYDAPSQARRPRGARQ